MQLVKMQCPNCNGEVRQVGEGKYLCERCGTSFLADYDKEDVEYQKLKLISEREKMQHERVKSGMNNPQRPQQLRKEAKGLAIVVLSVFFVSFLAIGMIIIGIVNSAGREASRSYDQYKKRQESQEARTRESEERARAKEEEAKRLQEEKESKAAEEKAAKLEALKITPQDLLADDFFLENANAAMRSQLEKNSHLYYTNWVWNEEPEYLTSYILLAKDEENAEHNILISIYKVHWDKVFDDRTEHYIMYDGACLYNVSQNEDGTIQTDYVTHPFSNNSEIVTNQFLHGYSDYDQMIRQEIYGKSDYQYVEFQFPEENDTE